MEKNVGIIERGLSLAFGAAALTKVILSREATLSNGIAGTLGATLLFRGATGFCPAYRAMGVDHEGEAPRRMESDRWKRSLIVQQPMSDLANLLRHRGMPDFTFDQVGGMNSFMGRHHGLRWTLTLEEGQPDSTTYLRAEVVRDLDDPAGTQKLSKKLLEELIDGQLRNLKALAETGEIATVHGQPEGQRSLFGKAASAASAWISEKTQASPEISTYPMGEREVQA